MPLKYQIIALCMSVIGILPVTSQTPFWTETFSDETSALTNWTPGGTNNGTEIWKYRNRSEKDTEVGLFLVFSVDIEEERTETLSIEFIDGLVTNYSIEEDRF